MLQRGDSIPHFEVRGLEGGPFKYSTIWQHKNLLLVVLPTLDSELSKRSIAVTGAYRSSRALARPSPARLPN